MPRTRKRQQTKLIIFSTNYEDFEGSQEKYFGFSILPVDTAKRFLLAVKLLAENQSTFTIGSVTLPYNKNYFTVTSLSTAEQKVLINLFDADIEDENSNGCIGIMPNAIQDAYDEYLLEVNDEESDEVDEYYDEQDDENY